MTHPLRERRSLGEADARVSMKADDLSRTHTTCRSGCAACCIAPSISSAIPGMREGKPAGVPCVQLDAALRCRLFGRPERPAVCASLQPDATMCGTHREHALQWLTQLESETAPH